MPLPVERMPEGEARPRLLGYALNVSETGVFVQCATPRPPGTRLRLHLRIPGVPDPLVCRRARIAWVRPYSGWRGPAAGVGIRLGGMRAADRAAWGAFCQSLADAPRSGPGCAPGPA